VKLPNSVAVMGKLSSLAASAAESFALTHWPPSLDILLEHQILNCNSCFGQNHAFHQLLLMSLYLISNGFTFTFPSLKVIAALHHSN
jgi:hypothetical protein